MDSGFAIDSCGSGRPRRTQVTSELELPSVGQWDPASPTGLGCLGFQEPGGFLPVACLENRRGYNVDPHPFSQQGPCVDADSVQRTC